MSEQPSEVDANEGLELKVLQKKRYDFEAPTSSHFTLEVSAYWNNDLLDQVESGRRRSVSVGGYTGGRKADLIVEVPQEVKGFVIAKIRGTEATITVPESAQFALRKADAAPSRDAARVPVSAPFSAYGVKIGFGDRIAFRMGKLTFACEFVRSHGRVRHPWDWLIPRWMTA